MKNRFQKRVFPLFILSFALFALSACDQFLPTLEAGEYGVKFVKLPPSFGGGLKSTIIEPGQKEPLMPWEELYRVDTTIQSLSWGARGEGTQPKVEDSVQTRTIDGNEVLLAMTIQYHIDPKMVQHVIQYVAGEPGRINSRIRTLISAVAGADIRTHLNTLSTTDFFSQSQRQEALDELAHGMNARLNPEGIIIDSVIYNDHRFERVLSDGTSDDSYQEKIDRTQATVQETEQERKRIGVVKEEKKKEYNEKLAGVNRIIQEAKGRKEQAKLRGDSYLTAKAIEAEKISTVGLEQIKAIKKRIEALSGPGGEALLRIEIAEALTSGDGKFVVVQSGSSSGESTGIGVNKIDTNQLVEQLGLIEGVSPSRDKSTVGQSAAPVDDSKTVK